MQNEIEGVQIRRLVTNDLAETNLLEVFLDSIRRQLFLDDFVSFGRICHDTDVAAVTFIAGPGECNFRERYLHDLTFTFFCVLLMPRWADSNPVT